MQEEDYKKLIEKYKSKVREEFGDNPTISPRVTSIEYSEFKDELYPTHYSIYEKLCNFSEKVLRLKADPKKAEIMQKDIEACHLNATPSGVISLSILLPLIVIFVGSLVSFAIFHLIFLVMFFLILGMLMIPALQKTPNFMSTTWRMKASNQMVQSIFYMVTYMRHTSNLERAIEFAANHLEPPL